MRQQTHLGKLLQAPLALDLSPEFPNCRLGAPSIQMCASFAVYVERPAASGLAEILPTLRQKVRADVKPSRASLRYSSLAGNGLRLRGGISAWVEGESTDGTEQPASTSFLRYRLIVTDGLEPIGYCTFLISVGDDAAFDVDVSEVWLDARYRGIALGRALARKVALIAMSAFEQVDSRAAEVGLKSCFIRPTVCGDVYSASGARFVENVASALAFETYDATWFSVEIGGIARDLRW